MRYEDSKRRYLRPSVLLIAGGTLLAALALFLFPGGEVRLVACALVTALTAVLHRSATTGSTRNGRRLHEGRAEHFDRAQPIPVPVEDSR